MPATSETRTYDALASTTLENWSKGIGDEITTSMFFFFQLKRSGSWRGVSALGERCKYTLRYQNGTADSFSGYDILNTTPMDGITAAFFDWRQMAVPISISRIERRKNAGEYQFLDLLEAKSNQAMDGIKELFAKSAMQGNGPNSATAITTAYTSPTNNSSFVDPLPLLVGQTPSSGTIGSIAASNSWWQNQKAAATDTNFASFLKDLSHMYNLCSKGVGGGPDTHLMDQSTFEFYEAALRSQHQFTQFSRADIPFDNVAFKGKPAVWDEFFPNWSGGTTTQSTTQGTWLMLNSKHIQYKYDTETNFMTTPMVTPENQDASTAQILLYISAGIDNRRKHGVLSDIDTTLTS